MSKIVDHIIADTSGQAVSEVISSGGDLPATNPADTVSSGGDLPATNPADNPSMLTMRDMEEPTELKSSKSKSKDGDKGKANPKRKGKRRAAEEVEEEEVEVEGVGEEGVEEEAEGEAGSAVPTNHSNNDDDDETDEEVPLTPVLQSSRILHPETELSLRELPDLARRNKISWLRSQSTLYEFERQNNIIRNEYLFKQVFEGKRPSDVLFGHPSSPLAPSSTTPTCTATPPDLPSPTPATPPPRTCTPPVKKRKAIHWRI